MSDANRITLSYVAESTFGVTPSGPPTLKDLRLTKDGLMQQTQMVLSNDLRSDRMRADVIRTNINAQGDIGFEFNAVAYDDLLLYSLLAAAWAPTTPTLVTQTAIVVTVSIPGAVHTLTAASGTFFSTLVVGEWVRIGGFVNAANNGYVKILTNNGTTIITVATEDGAAMAVETGPVGTTYLRGAAAAQGTTLTSLAIERKLGDLTSEFAIYNGMCIDTLALQGSSTALLTGSVGFMGKKETSAAATAGTGTNTAVGTNPVMNCVDNILAFSESGTSFGITQFALNLKNNLRGRNQIGSLGLISVGTGTVDVTGTYQGYYVQTTAKALADKYLNQTVTSLAFVIQDSSNNAYLIELPRVKYTSMKRVAGGINTDVILDIGWTAYRDPTTGNTIKITRF